MKLMVYTVMGAKDDLQVRAVDISTVLLSHSYTVTSELYEYKKLYETWLKSTKENTVFSALQGVPD